MSCLERGKNATVKGTPFIRTFLIQRVVIFLFLAIVRASILCISLVHVSGHLVVPDFSEAHCN